MDSDLPAIDPFQRMEPSALINLVPGPMAEAMALAHKEVPHLLGMAEQALKKALKEINKQPCPTDNRIRLCFWAEYDNAQAENRKMKLAPVFARVCTPIYFYQGYLTDPYKIAWLICMPANYENKIKELLEFGLEQMRDILALDHCPGGKPNTKLMEIKAKITALAELRDRGAVIQRVDQRTLSVNVSDKRIESLQVENNMEDINKRIKYLESLDKDSQRINERAQRAGVVREDIELPPAKPKGS